LELVELHSGTGPRSMDYTSPLTGFIQVGNTYKSHHHPNFFSTFIYSIDSMQGREMKQSGYCGNTRTRAIIAEQFLRPGECNLEDKY